jgi:hypothetical protein
MSFPQPQWLNYLHHRFVIRAQTRAGTLSVEIEMLTNAASALSRQTAAFLVPCTLVRVACAAARSKSDRCLHGRQRRGS